MSDAYLSNPNLKKIGINIEFTITSINNEKKIGNNKEEIDKIKKRDSK